MTPRVVAALAVAAVISVGLAVASYRANHQALSLEGAGQRLLPDLVQRANDVAEITVTEAGKALTVKKAEGERWVVADSGYPATPSKISRVLVNLAAMSRLEPKTANAEKYALLELDAPNKSGTKGRLFTLKDSKGGVVGEAILGKSAPGRAGPGKEAQYVRLPNEPESWLVLGAVEASVDVKDWANTSLLALGPDAIAVARFRGKDGSTLEIRRTGKTADGAAQFHIQGLPDKVALKEGEDPGRAATDLASLDFTDVRASKAAMTPVRVAEIDTDKGLKLGFSVVDDAGQSWLTLQVLALGSDKATADKIAELAKGREFAVTELKAKQFKRALADFLATP